jgi:hypothetical protein
MNSSQAKNETALKVMTCAAMLATLAGCGGKSTSTITTTPPAQTESVYVIQNPATFGMGSGTILQFLATSSGSVSPKSTITAPANTSFSSLATDTSGNIYVTANSSTALDLRVYAAGATGAATPMRLIPSNNTTMMWAPDGIVASASGEIYVGEDTGGVATYSATANGATAKPQQYILGYSQTGGGLSTLIAADQVAADSSGNLYILAEGNPVGPGPILLFSPTATGNVAPSAVLGGAASKIDSANALTTDSAGNLYVANNTFQTNGASVGGILVFAPPASGNVAPTRTISGSATTMGTLWGIKVDSTGNIFVVSTDSTAKNPTVLKFSPTASGNVAPVSSFTSSAWTQPDNGVSIAVF